MVRNALAVDVERRRAVDTELPPLDHVALDLLSKFVAVERRVKPRAVKTEVSCVLPELVNSERRLIAEKYPRVLPVLTLLTRGLGSFGRFARGQMCLDRCRAS